MIQELKFETGRVRKSNWWQLIYQGLYLHFASFWGPLHASKKARENKKWLISNLTGWGKEYGLNFIVSLLVVSIGYLYFDTVSMLTLLAAFSLPPLLTVLQMFIDNYLRKDIIVLYDTETRSGLTVRKVSENTYGFYNHYALPIGDRNGKTIRNWLHNFMKEKQTNLQCIAQNETIANHYLRERENGISAGGKRPLMIWEYSGSPTVLKDKESLLERLIGLNSMRNSGQLPLLAT